MQGLAQEVWRLAPTHINVDDTVGELAWATRQHAGREAEWKRQLWTDDGSVVAWAWIFAPAHLCWKAHPGRPEMIDVLLDWFEAETDPPRHLDVALENAAAVDVLHARGYEIDPEATKGLMNVRELEEIEEPVVPDGYRLTTMREHGDYDARVEIHRVVWHPSRVTRESYDNVRSTWPYRDDLDCVLVGPDGGIVAYTLCWYDDETGVGEFEPVGVHPDHRRLGLGRAINLFGLHRMRAAGATTAIVACNDDDEKNPGPKALYRSVGFRELARQRVFKQG